MTRTSPICQDDIRETNPSFIVVDADYATALDGAPEKALHEQLLAGQAGETHP